MLDYAPHGVVSRPRNDNPTHMFAFDFESLARVLHPRSAVIGGKNCIDQVRSNDLFNHPRRLTQRHDPTPIRLAAAPECPVPGRWSVADFCREHDTRPAASSPGLWRGIRIGRTSKSAGEFMIVGPGLAVGQQFAFHASAPSVLVGGAFQEHENDIKTDLRAKGLQFLSHVQL